MTERFVSSVDHKGRAALVEAQGRGGDPAQRGSNGSVSAVEHSQRQLNLSKRILSESGCSPDDLKLWMPRRPPGRFT